MRSRWGMVLVVGLLLGFLASCGNEPEKLTSKTLFAKVSKAQAAAKSSHISMRLTAPDGQTFSSYGQMRLGPKVEDTAMAMTVSGDTGGLGSVELRLVDRTFYVALGSLTQGKFAKIDLTDTSNPIARQYGEIIQNVDPARQVRQYEDAITKFDTSGKTVKIDGVQTQPYKISIDPSKAVELDKLGDDVTLAKRIDFTLYVGPDNLPRRMVSTVPGPGGKSRLQMDYSKWGEKVSIAPPAKENIAEGDLFSRLGGATTEPAPAQ